MAVRGKKTPEKSRSLLPSSSVANRLIGSPLGWPLGPPGAGGWDGLIPPAQSQYGFSRATFYCPGTPTRTPFTLEMLFLLCSVLAVSARRKLCHCALCGSESLPSVSVRTRHHEKDAFYRWLARFYCKHAGRYRGGEVAISLWLPRSSPGCRLWPSSTRPRPWKRKKNRYQCLAATFRRRMGSRLVRNIRSWVLGYVRVGSSGWNLVCTRWVRDPTLHAYSPVGRDIDGRGRFGVQSKYSSPRQRLPFAYGSRAFLDRRKRAVSRQQAKFVLEKGPVGSAVGTGRPPCFQKTLASRNTIFRYPRRVGCLSPRQCSTQLSGPVPV